MRYVNHNLRRIPGRLTLPHRPLPREFLPDGWKRGAKRSAAQQPCAYAAGEPCEMERIIAEDVQNPTLRRAVHSLQSHAGSTPPPP